MVMPMTFNAITIQFKLNGYAEDSQRLVGYADDIQRHNHPS